MDYKYGISKIWTGSFLIGEKMYEDIGMKVIGVGIGLLLISVAIGIGCLIYFGSVEAISKWEYCESQGVPKGLCSDFIRENFASSNVKLRIKDENK
jgi:hypothetical protein